MRTLVCRDYWQQSAKITVFFSLSFSPGLTEDRRTQQDAAGRHEPPQTTGVIFYVYV